MLLLKNWHKIKIQDITLTWHFEHFTTFCHHHLLSSSQNVSSAVGCTPQAYTPCSCPASKLKKEPGDRGVSGLFDRGSYTKGPGTTPCQTDACRTLQQSLLPKGEGDRLQEGIGIRWAHQLPGTN